MKNILRNLGITSSVFLMTSVPAVAQTAIAPVTETASDILETLKVLLPAVAFMGIVYVAFSFYKGRIEGGRLWAAIAATLLIGMAPWIVTWLTTIGGGYDGVTIASGS